MRVSSKKEFLLFLLFLVSITSRTVGDPLNHPVLLLGDQGDVDLVPYFTFLHDPEGRLTLDDILKEKYQSQFVPLKDEGAGKWRSTYWLKLTVIGDPGVGLVEDRILQFFVPPLVIREIDYFEPQGTSNYREVFTGDQLPYDTRDIDTSVFSFSFSSPKKTAEKTVYFRIHGPAHTTSLNPRLSSMKAFSADRRFTEMIVTIFYSVVTVMFIYNFILWMYLKTFSHFAYLLLIVGVVLLISRADGSYTKLGGTNDYLNPIPSYISLPLHVVFVYFVLEAGSRISWARKLVQVVVLVDVALIVAFSIFGGLVPPFIGPLAFPFNYSIILLLIIASIYRRTPLAGSILLAELFWVTGMIVGVMAYTGIMGLDRYLYYVVGKIGVLCELTLFALVLGKKSSQAISSSLEKERQLISAQQQIIREKESSEKLKDSFMSTITHELLTPINGIRLSLSLLKPGLEKSHHEFLEAATNSNRHMLNLIESMITFTEAKRGSLKLKRETFDAKQLLQAIYHQFEKGSRKPHKLLFDYDAETPVWIVSDTKKLGIIVVELLKNAVTFTEQGEIELSCSACESSETGKIIFSLSVRDTGTGMTEDVQSHIFEGFSQADSSITREHYGLGIGLTMVSDILKLLKGSLVIDSEQGKGSTFTLNVPIELPTAQQIKEEQQIAKQAVVEINTEGSRLIKNAKILVVEDNAVNMMLLVRVLEQANYEVLSAEHGEKAIAALKENRDISAILMDCQMPVMDGFEATRQIRTMEGFGDLPIIAVTANVSEEDQQRCRDAGMSDYLTKPANPALIEQMLGKWLIKSLRN